MASHQLAIAKASFSAGLLRPDPTSVSRENIEHFHSLLNATITQSTPKNVQKCKHWILQHVAQSAARFTSLGKYLTALAASFNPSTEDQSQRTTSVKRKRLHILYLVNDILHHAKNHSNDVSIYGKVQPLLVGLIGSATSFKGCPKHHGKVRDLLDIWEEKEFYSKNYIDKLRETAKNAAEGLEPVDSLGTSSGQDASSATKSKSTPFVMPASHGDPSLPWFDLPAANLMPHIVPNSTRPINPDMIKPLQLIAGPADEHLVTAVKSLLDDVEAIFGETERSGKASWDIDELGQPIALDEITGDVIDGEGYYGWSRSFCEKMKRRKQGLDVGDLGESRDRKGRSRSSSRSVRKRRYSDSDDASSQDGFRNRRRRRSYSSSRSPDRGRNGLSGRNSRSRSYSKSPQRSPSSPRRTDSYPRQAVPPPNSQDGIAFQPSGPNIPPPPMPFQQGFNPNFPPPPPPLHSMPPNMPFNGQGAPPFGSWPPPPPMPPNVNYNPSQPWPPPPPPPGNPPLGLQQHQQPFYGGYAQPGPGGWQQGEGRGYSNNNGWNNGPPNRGRGNFRGRGRGW